MKHKSTDHLIADVLAMGMELRKHLEDRRRRLTPLRMDALTSAVAAMHNYFMSWKAHELAAGVFKAKEFSGYRACSRYQNYAGDVG